MGAPAAVGDAQRQRPVFGVIKALAAAQRVAGFDQTADFIVGVMPFTTLWVGGLEQLPGEHLVLPAVAQRVDVFVDQWPPKLLPVETETGLPCQVIIQDQQDNMQA